MSQADGVPQRQQHSRKDSTDTSRQHSERCSNGLFVAVLITAASNGQDRSRYHLIWAVPLHQQEFCTSVGDSLHNFQGYLCTGRNARCIAVPVLLDHPASSHHSNKPQHSLASSVPRRTALLSREDHFPQNCIVSIYSSTVISRLLRSVLCTSLGC